jgi:hypothetical protein
VIELLVAIAIIAVLIALLLNTIEQTHGVTLKTVPPG